MPTKPERAVTQATVAAWLRTPPSTAGQHRIHRVAPGLDLYVYADGSASWFWRARPRGARPDGRRWPQQRLRIGDTATVPLQQALAEAARLKGLIAKGADPAGERRHAIAARREAAAVQAARATCRDLLTGYTDAVAARGSSAIHTTHEEMHVRRGLTAVGLFDVPPDAIDLAAIERVLAATPLKSRSHRLKALTRFLSWGLRRIGSTAAPPTTLLARHERPQPSAPRSRVLRLEEIACVWHAAATMGEAIGDLVRLLCAVPCRRGEAAGMRWQDLDLGAGTWSQAHTKNRIPHIFYLPDVAISLLQERRRACGLAPDTTALVFPASPAGDTITSWSHPKERLDALLKAAGAELAAWTFHDLRRSFVTLAVDDLGADDGLVDLIVNHVPSRTKNRVSRTYNLSQRKADRVRLMGHWDRALRAAIDGAVVAPGAEIVSLPMRG